MSVRSISHKSSLDSLKSDASSVLSDCSAPDRLPSLVRESRTWDDSTLGPDQYIDHLGPQEIGAIRSAVIAFKLSGLQRSDISQATFPLPTQLVTRLESLSERIHSGCGVAVLRGLDAARLNDEESVIAFAGVSSYVCSERATDSYANQTLSHVRDATRDSVPVWAQGVGLAASKLPTSMEFHSDRFSGDVLALYLKDMGDKQCGGDQYLASFSAIYNNLLELAPDVLETLAAANWPFELKDKEKNTTYLEYGPILFFSEGKPMCQLVRAPLLGSPRIPRSVTMPKLSNEQVHALQLVEDVARRLCIKLDRRTGDVQFVNNLSVMHARSAYNSSEAGKGSGRHLLRMFLRDPIRCWAKPTRFARKFEDPFNKERPQNIPILDLDPWRAISGRESHG